MMPRNPLLASALGVAVLAGTCVSNRPAVAQDGFGTIKGRVVWGGAEVPKLEPKVKKGDAGVKDAAVCAVNEIPNEEYVVDPATKGVANAFAYVATPKGINANAEQELLSKSPSVVIDQKGCRFVPHAVAMHKGQELIFKSSDPVGHNIRYNGFNVGGFNQMLAPNGKQGVKLVAAEPNPVQLQCDIHPWMTGAFMVFDHPFFAVTKPDGSFEITGVPAGKQKIIVREDKGKFITPNARRGVEVEVKPGDVTDVGELRLMPAK
jgi:plastocyanin